jgi:hypothetical protein
VRAVVSPSAVRSSALDIGQDSLLWMTNVTIQSIGVDFADCETCGLVASAHARMFADGMPRLWCHVIRWPSRFINTATPVMAPLHVKCFTAHDEYLQQCGDRNDCCVCVRKRNFRGNWGTYIVSLKSMCRRKVVASTLSP